MKRLTTIALFSAFAVFAACNKDSTKAAPAKTEASATGPAGATAGSTATAGQAAAAAGQAAAVTGQAGDQAAAAGQAAAAAGQAAAAAGQAAAAAGKALSDAEVEQLGGKMLSMMESVASAVESNSADCGAMAAAVEKVIADNQPLMAEVKAAGGAAANDGKFEAWMDKNKARAEALTTKIGPGMTKCAGDAKLQEAFSKLSM